MALRLDAQTCQKRLALLWFVAAGALLAVVIAQSLAGFYGKELGDAWGWLAPNVVPTTSLMIGTLAVSLKGDAKTVDAYLYRLAFGVSVFYLVVVGAILAAGCMGGEPTKMMASSNIFLAPLQGLATAALGIFFLKTE